jgi:hypothetical protein
MQRFARSELQFAAKIELADTFASDLTAATLADLFLFSSSSHV